MKLETLRENYDVRNGKTYPAPLVRIGNPTISDVCAGIVHPVKMGDEKTPLDYIRVQPIFTKATYAKKSRRTGYHLVTLLSVKRGDPRETMREDYEPEFTEIDTRIISGRTRLQLMYFLNNATGSRKEDAERELDNILNLG